MNFYSHIPCGMWLTLLAVSPFLMYFYSHIPCGMWLLCFRSILCHLHFYSHIPCGMWPLRHVQSFAPPSISTHTSLVGCDGVLPLHSWAESKFLLTHPLWDVTNNLGAVLAPLAISTHTSLVGCDSKRDKFSNLVCNFYSHIPCGMWLSHGFGRLGTQSFLLTHPLWDVTCLRLFPW